MFSPAQVAKIPNRPKNDFRVENFLGVDMTNDPYNVADNRASSAPNGIRREKGTFFKRPGYKTVRKYPDRINGIHILHSETEIRLVHSGAKLDAETPTTPYAVDASTAIYSDMKDERSVSKQLNKMLYILDGKKYLVYGKFDGAYKVKPVSEIAYVPTVLIATTATGGGAVLEPVNLLTPRRKQTIIGDNTNKTYQLGTINLDSDPVIVLKNNATGGKDTLVEGKDFVVDRPLGKITFTALHPAIIAGIPNLEVEYSATKEGYADRINLCDIATLYGVSGSRDRLFVSGNAKFPNYDWYSQLNDPSYFGDLWYSVLGQDNSAITGYSIVNDYLAAHKNRSDDDTNVFLRRGVLTDGKATFLAAGSLQGAGAIAKHSFGTMETEPLFLTKDGVFAITPADMGNRDYAQLRSCRVNKALLAEKNLEQATAFVHEQFYYLSINGNVYILDGEQFEFEKNYPYSTRQYEAYFWTNVDARVWFEDGGICFGTADGSINRFNLGSAISDYTDNGKPVHCQWVSQRISEHFEAEKTFKRLYTIMAPFPSTSVQITADYSNSSGRYKEVIEEYSGIANFFTFSQLRFSTLNFSNDNTPRKIRIKFKVKKANNLQFVFENDRNEPFGLYAIDTKCTERVK